MCRAGRNDPKVPSGAGRFRAASAARAPRGPGGEGSAGAAAGRGGRAEPHLHAGVVFEEEEHHVLIDAVEPVVHRLVEARGQEGGQQPPGPPGQHVGGRRAQQHGRRQHAAHRVHVEHQGQQHLPGPARGTLRRLLPPRPPPGRLADLAGGQSPRRARPRRRPLRSPGRRPHLRRPARARSGLRPQPHGPRRRRGVDGLAGVCRAGRRGRRGPSRLGSSGALTPHDPRPSPCAPAGGGAPRQQRVS